MDALVICKITNAVLRKSVYAILMDRGFSPVPGVFECDLGHLEFKNIRQYLAEINYGPDDYVILYSICAVCHKNCSIFGNPPVHSRDSADWIII